MEHGANGALLVLTLSSDIGRDRIDFSSMPRFSHGPFQCGCLPPRPVAEAVIIDALINSIY